MANGLSINGVVQSRGFGLGSVVTWASGEVPSMYVDSVSPFGRGNLVANSAVKSLCRGELIPGVGSPSAFSPFNTCGIDGSPACSYGSPQSALSGLGNVLPNYASFCTDLTAVLDELQNIRDHAYESLSEASKVNLDATLSALGGFSVYVPFIGTDCQRHIAEASAALTDLRAELGPNAPPLLRPHVDAGGTPTPYGTDSLSPLVKVAIGVGIAAVALGALGYSAGNLARLFRSR